MWKNSSYVAIERVFGRGSRKFSYVNVQAFCGKIPKVYVRECAGVLRDDLESLRA